MICIFILLEEQFTSLPAAVTGVEHLMHPPASRLALTSQLAEPVAQQPEQPKQLKSLSQAQQESSTQEPRCGIYYFYHIPKCGGSSVRSWMQKLAYSHPHNITYVNWCEITHGWEEHASDVWKLGLHRMERIVESGELANNNDGWLAVHHHHRSPGLRFMMPRLREWKELLKSQGCDLVLATMLREPFPRVQSMISYNKISKKNLPSFAQNFEGQARYLLYN
jgi:hypothetical protein